MPDLTVLDSTIHYEETGGGVPIVFLHGNPGSSYVWRHVLPEVGAGRLLAPDLIGMGRSGKPDIGYRFADHADYLAAWLDALELEHVVLIGHDWGGALAFDWASRHPDRVAGLAFLEAIVKPMADDELSPQALKRVQMLRGPAGEELALASDRLIRQAFTGGGVLTPVADDDLAVYLAPFPTPESRRPLLAWARQLPVAGEPTELIARIEAYDAWLARSAEIPKLLLTFHGSPTLLSDDRVTAWCADNIAALEIKACGLAAHHAPEDRPREIGAALRVWLDRHHLR